MEVYGESIRGLSHEKNEDRFLIDSKNNLFAVADGVTYPSGGDLAAEFTLNLLKERFDGNLAQTVKIVNELLCEKKVNSSIGYTTLTAVVIKDDVAEIVSVGDSPCFLVRDDRIVLMNKLDRSIDGSLSGVIGDLFIILNVSSLKLVKGDYLLLMTDGLSDVLSLGEIKSIVADNKNPKKIVEELIRKAKSKFQQYNDDKTVVVIRYD